MGGNKRFGIAAVVAVSGALLSDCDAYHQFVGPPPCDAMSIGGPQGPLTVGDTLRLSVRLRNAQNRPVSCVGSITATWSSSAAQVASITSDGLLRALSPGQAIITARSDDMRQVLTIRVVANGALSDSSP